MRSYTEEEILKFHFLSILSFIPFNEKEQSNQIFSAILVNSASNQDTSMQTRIDRRKSKTHLSYFTGEINDEVIHKIDG